VEEIDKAEAKRVITSCSGCYRTLKRDYPKIGVAYGFEVLHTVHLLEELLKENKISLKSSDDVSYSWHDPCHLGRHMNVYDTPRNVMQMAGIDYLEMKQNRENAWCCGAGGGARAAYSDWSLVTAKKRIDQVEGTTNIVTACPFCVKNLRDTSEGKFKVYDLVELVDRLL
jgi:Fe-S oxidoreductase